MSSDSPVSAQWPVMPVADFVRSSSSGSATVSTTNSPRNAIGNELIAVEDEHATVVVVDQLAQLVGDRHADLAHVVQAVELAAQALQHLQVRDRADVALVRRRVAAARSTSSSKRTI